MGHQGKPSDVSSSSSSSSGLINNPYGHLKKSLSVDVGGGEVAVGEYYDVVGGFQGEGYLKLPYSIRILLESAVRKCDNVLVKELDVQRIAAWGKGGSDDNKDDDVEIQFSPARVVLQDFTGVPAVVDLAAMRDAVVELGGRAEDVNPVCPTDLVIDHSVQVDYFGGPNALERNEELEFERNQERFSFLKWGATAFKNMLIVPPGNGIVHQVNLEYLARVVFTRAEVAALQVSGGDITPPPTLFYPDSVVGTDSHTTMINEQCIFRRTSINARVTGYVLSSDVDMAWSLQAEAVMMGLPMSMVLPKVIGYRLVGTLGSSVTSTDVVLTITKNLRTHGVVGKFVEFFGPGLSSLTIADRATISNMCPEYGATCAFFPVDHVTIQYLRQSNRAERDIAVIEEYLRANGLFSCGGDGDKGIQFSEVIELNLSTVVTCLSGPKRPHDKVDLSTMKLDFHNCLRSKIGFKGYGITREDRLALTVPFSYDGVEYVVRHGSVLIAAITSCTNTSNPSVMLGAGLLARKAVAAGLSVPPYIKTSLSPGSGVVTYYLNESGVIEDLKGLGFDIVGYGCMTCIGNSGPLPEEVEKVVEGNPDLVCCGVLSGNRNFEGRIHPLLRANYLASPLLVIAYALAGRIDIDFETEPVQGSTFLRDIWPSREEIRGTEERFVLPRMFKSVYSKIQDGNPRWNALKVDEGVLRYSWNSASSYIRRPPFVSVVGAQDDGGETDLLNARCLLYLGDSVTTDHISPAGSIARNSPAARYLAGEMGLSPKEFNSYGSRRGNDQVMARGTFANIRLVNKLNKDESGNVVPGARTLYIPTNEIMDIYDASLRYSTESPSTPLIVIAGKDYGSGSSRDWAAKGPKLLNIRAVIAESYERIHRSNLVGMGVLPLQFLEGDGGESLGLGGEEGFSIFVGGGLGLRPKGVVRVETSTGKSFDTIVRIDTDVELDYYKSGGILPFLVKRIAGKREG